MKEFMHESPFLFFFLAFIAILGGTEVLKEMFRAMGKFGGK